MFKSLVLFSCVLCVYGGSVLFPGEILFNFYPEGSESDYELHLPSEVVSSYSFIGVGLKSTSDGKDYSQFDYSIITVKDNKGYDYWAQDKEPILDTILGGTENIQGFKAANINGGRLCMWPKALKTGDSFDLAIEVGKSYYVTLYLANLDENSNLVITENEINQIEYTEEFFGDFSNVNYQSFL